MWKWLPAHLDVIFRDLGVIAKEGLQSEGKAIQGCGNGLPQPMSTLILSVSCES